MPSSLASTLGRKALCPPTLIPRKKTIKAMLPIVAAPKYRGKRRGPTGGGKTLVRSRLTGVPVERLWEHNDHVFRRSSARDAGPDDSANAGAGAGARAHHR